MFGQKSECYASLCLGVLLNVVNDITPMLKSAEQGDLKVAQELLPLVHDEL